MSQITSYNSSGGGGSEVLTLTGNSGGPVGPDLGNINIVGSGGVLVAGNAFTSTLTITVPSAYFNYTLVNTSPYVVLSTDYYLGVDCSGGAIQINFPNAPTTYTRYVVKDFTGSSASHHLTLTTVGGSVNIDGGTTYVMNNNYQSVQLLFDGTEYQIF